MFDQPITQRSLPKVSVPSLNIVNILTQFIRREPLGACCGLLIIIFILAALFAPLIATHHYSTTNVQHRLADPDMSHWLGTDNLGRDVYSRLVWGTRVSMFSAFLAVFTSMTTATLIGSFSGYFGKWFDVLFQRVVDMWMSFPGVILVLTLIAMFGQGLWSVAIAIGLVNGGLASRLVRSSVIAIRQSDFVKAATVLGAGDLRVLVRHILPNVAPVLIVMGTAQVGIAILYESTVSYLGYGVRPPQPTWGSMLSGDARTFMLQQPLLALWPGIAIFLAVYSFNMLGDALRDTLDPRLRGSR